MRAVEDFDIACRGCLGVHAPEEIVGAFGGRRGLKRRDGAALRVQLPCHLADRPIFTAGIAPLQDDEDTLLPHRVQQLLQFQNLVEELGSLVRSFLSLESRVLCRIKLLELNLAPALHPMCIAHNALFQGS